MDPVEVHVTQQLDSVFVMMELLTELVTLVSGMEPMGHLVEEGVEDVIASLKTPWNVIG